MTPSQSYTAPMPESAALEPVSGIDPQNDARLWKISKLLIAVGFAVGIVALGAVAYLSMNGMLPAQLSIDTILAKVPTSRIGEVFDRVSNYGIWGYFSDPYILATSLIIVLAFIYNRFSLYLIVVPIVSLLGPGIIYYLVTHSIEINLMAGIENGFVKFLIFMIVADFFGWIAHWLMHSHKALWEIHKFHHSCTEMNIVTGTRDHPFEKAYQKMFTAAPLALLGAPTETFLIVLLIQYAHGIMQHSDWDISFGIFDYIFISPHMHRIHHSITEEHWDLNYGIIFSFWDRIFGTLYKGSNKKAVIDVTDNYFNQRGIWYDLVMPMAKFAQQMGRSPFEMMPKTQFNKDN